MHRQKLVLLTVAGALVVATGPAAAQAPKPAATPAQGAPAERARLVAPVRGVAQIGYTKPVVKRGKVGGKDFVITTMQSSTPSVAVRRKQSSSTTAISITPAKNAYGRE